MKFTKGRNFRHFFYLLVFVCGAIFQVPGYAFNEPFFLFTNTVLMMLGLPKLFWVSNDAQILVMLTECLYRGRTANYRRICGR